VSGTDLVQCLTCAYVFYRTAKGMTPKHMPDGRKNDGGGVAGVVQPRCIGGGLPGKPIERTTGQAS
jgi:hypothetical protein